MLLCFLLLVSSCIQLQISFHISCPVDSHSKHLLLSCGAKLVFKIDDKMKKLSALNQVLRFYASKCFFGHFIFSLALSASIRFVIMRFTLAYESCNQVKGVRKCDTIDMIREFLHENTLRSFAVAIAASLYGIYKCSIITWKMTASHRPSNTIEMWSLYAQKVEMIMQLLANVSCNHCKSHWRVQKISLCTQCTWCWWPTKLCWWFAFYSI